MTTSDSIQIFIGIVTLLTALVALFGERFWRWVERSRIHVYFNDKDIDCYHLTTMDYFDQEGKIITSIPAYYIRLKISNFGGLTLNNTEVVLERVEPKPSTFMSLNLSWAGFTPDGSGITRTIRIPQGQSRIIDVIEVMEPSQQGQFSNNLVQDDPRTKRFQALSKGFRSCSIKPNNLADIFSAGNYIFHIGIYADNTKPKRIKLSVKYDGTWGQSGMNGMRLKHLRIKLIQ